ncbi:MAG: DoxX family membrane protein, partial [Dehalococcoidia bacterium]|nr:DoxX family membrane protein [Dehalococcoidia bacterium]
RLVLAVVFLTAGTLKLVNPGAFAAAIQAYDVVPVGLLRPIALVFPWVEVAIGLLLLTGTFTRAAAGAAVGLLLVFIALIAQALARNLNLQGCGCFGDLTREVPALMVLFGSADAGVNDLVRDAIYAALGVVLIINGRTPLSVDGLVAEQSHR